ncbi:MAG: DUF4091 domain-containing protein [Clostridiales bacterium]|jgi:hypothetical protein|nr:DUF4091 domain-containing protein [Clostridiales bacterium]
MKKMVTILAALALFGAGITWIPRERNAVGVIAEGGVTVKVALPTQKITRDEDVSALDGGPLYIGGAKGETTGGQIIIRPSGDVKSYGVTASDLTSAAGTIGKDNVLIYAEVYTLATQKPYAKILPDGWYPDALMPVKFLAAKGENAVTANQNQGFWIDVKIPATAAAGSYGGSVVIDLDGAQTTVPLSVTVYDFAMPSAPALRSSYLVWQDWLMDSELDNTTEKYRAYYELLADYNISAGKLPFTDSANYIEALRTYYNRVASFQIPYRSAGGRFNLDTAYVAEYLEAVARASVADGVNYFEKAYYYFDTIYDEPGSSQAKMDALAVTVKNTDDAEQAVINKLVAESVLASESDPIAMVMKNLHHIIPAFGRFDRADITWPQAVIDGVDPCPAYKALKTDEQIEYFRNLAASGTPVSTYGCITNDTFPNAAHEINDYLVTTRDLFWFDYENGFTGDLLWNVNNHVNTESMSGVRWGRVNDLYRQASHDTISNGDGYMVYPGLLYGSDKPFASIRLAAKRDGISDYTYMSVLDGLFKAKQADYGASGLSAQGVVKFLNQTLLGRGVSKLNNNGLAAARGVLAKLITLANSGVLVSGLAVDGDKINYQIYTPAAGTLDVNGSAATGTAAGSGLRFSGSLQMPSSKSLDLTFSGGAAVSIPLSAPYALLNAFETADNVNAIKVSSYAAATLNTSSAYALSGNSAKVELSGHKFPNDQATHAFKPQFYVEFNPDTVGAVKFSVYNPGATKTYEVFLETSAGTGTSVYDTVKLAGGVWTLITVDNARIVNRATNSFGPNTRVGLSTSNLLNGDTPYTVTLYVDNAYTAGK